MAGVDELSVLCTHHISGENACDLPVGVRPRNVDLGHVWRIEQNDPRFERSDTRVRPETKKCFRIEWKLFDIKKASAVYEKNRLKDTKQDADYNGYTTFRSGRFGLAVSVWAVSVWGHFGLGRFGLGTLRSDYEILQKSYIFIF